MPESTGKKKTHRISTLTRGLVLFIPIVYLLRNGKKILVIKYSSRSLHVEEQHLSKCEVMY